MRLGYTKRHTATAIILPLLGVVIISLVLTHFLLKRAEPTFIAQTSNYSNTAFTDLVNKCVLNVTKTEQFGDFFKVVSSDGITAMESDTSKINLITSRLLIDIQNALNGDYPATVYIPLGSLTNYHLLSSAGPVLPVKIIPISVVNSKLEDKFDSVGINQVRHTIYLRLWVDMHYRAFILDERERIETTIPIAQTIISGDVPQYYGSEMLFPAE